MSNNNGVRYLSRGETVRLKLPSSEVCIHMHLAGQVRKVQLLAGWDHEAVAQILNEDGTRFSSPVLTGEAGIYTEYGNPMRWYVRECDLREEEGVSPQ